MFRFTVNFLLGDEVLQYLLSEPFPKQSLVFTTLRNRPFENNVGKGENAGNHFLVFPVFSNRSETETVI